MGSDETDAQGPPNICVQNCFNNPWGMILGIMRSCVVDEYIHSIVGISNIVREFVNACWVRNIKFWVFDLDLRRSRQVEVKVSSRSGVNNQRFIKAFC